MKTTTGRILIVEDEQHLADGLKFNLDAEGYAADILDNGEAAVERLLGVDRTAYALVVLDVMLQGKDGFTVVQELRAADQFVPVLILTARGSDVVGHHSVAAQIVADTNAPRPTGSLEYGYGRLPFDYSARIFHTVVPNWRDSDPTLYGRR